jgi:hypothetical protein
VPIYTNPSQLASLQSNRKFSGNGAAEQNAAAADAKKDLTDFIGKIKLDVDACWKVTEPWRLQADESYRFVENDQWDSQDVAFMKQPPARPMLTFNDVLPIVRILSGIERQKAESFKVKPREGGDVDSAQVLTELLSYVDDENLGYYQRIRKSNDVNITGRGYIKTDISYDENVNGDIILKRRNPLTIFNDPMADEWDGTDRRWVAEGEWVTEDEAKELWPEFEDQIKIGDWLSNNTGMMSPNLVGDKLINSKLFLDAATKRVRIFDYWYKKVEPVMIAVNLDTGDTTTVDETFTETYQQMDPQTQQALKFMRRKVTTIRVATIMNWILMRDDISPFPHRYFPITPYVGLQYNAEPYGIVQYLKDPQRLANKGISQALNHLNRSANSGWLNHSTRGASSTVLEKFGSVPGIVINYQEEPPRQIDPTPLSAGHVNIVEFAKNQIKGTSLVNAEVQGVAEQGYKALSGKAIQARQQGGLVGNEDLFDNQLLGDKIVGMQLIAMIQQIFTPSRIERIVADKADVASSNMAMIFSQRKQELPVIIDKALKGEYDYIIDKSGGGLSARESMADRLTDITKTWAQYGQVPVSLIMATLKYLDLPSADVEAIKQEVMQQAMAAQMMAQAQAMGAPIGGAPGQGNGAGA